jgi:ubiquinone/menaquinone biosynthesis C-methylase UbiE
VPLLIDPDGVEIAAMRELVDFDDARVVEIGCGEGRMTFMYAREAASVFAFDPDEELIRDARAETPRALRRRIRFEAADAAEIELPRGEFDLALFSWSL